MSSKIPQHKHCQICGKAIPLEEKLCSEECKEKYEEMVKKRKILIYILYGAIIIMAIAIAIPLLTG
ncbi:MAG: DUF2116 family Zn-ribbon domain-containing protein [Candidatus Thermoplasmatota archaeon]